jgi:dihydroxyacetone kinase-like protein
MAMDVGKDIFDLTGRVAFVTGAASGLGQAAAIGFARYGADVACVDVVVDRPTESDTYEVDAAALDAAVAGAERAVSDTKALQSRRGRASWLQERSIGLQDPGATAFLRLLQCWQAALHAAPAERN